MTNQVKPLKIIFDATPMLVERTGIAYYTERLAVSLAKEFPDELELVGFYYNFLGRRDSSHLPRLKNLRYTRSTFIPSKIIYQLRRFGIELPIEFLTLERGDFLLFPNFISHPSLFKTPQAPVIHDLTFHDLPQYVAPKLRGDLKRFVPRDVKKRASFVITVSDFTKKRIMDEYNVPADKILVTHIPPIAPKIHSVADRQKALKKAGIKKQFILFVGTIDPRKNVTGLIEGYKNLPEHIRKQYSLVLAGRVELLATKDAAAIKKSKEDGYDVIHLGYISDHLKEVLFQTTSLFVTASQYEGFGMPILEAMSYNAPCAISNIDVFKEVAGDAAVYFDLNIPKSISKTLSMILGDSKALHKYGQLSGQRVKMYKWNKVAQDVRNKIVQTLR